MPGSYWECPRCGALNKAFAAVCFTCGGNTRKSAVPRPRPAGSERVQMTRGSRFLLGAALALSALVGYVLVRTFRSPALESASAQQPDADTGRLPVPPDATLPGAPDSGWPAPAGPVVASVAPPSLPGSVVARLPASPSPEPRPRAYTDADLRTLVATRGVAAVTHDRGYVLALRQRRVEDLRERLAAAHSPDERAKLEGWLDDALSDLERARR